MIPNPITTVLPSMKKNGVDCLPMGGQACVFYGGAECSRDINFVLSVSPDNLRRLRGALAALQAGVMAVPPFEMDYLKRGHAVHFRCAAAGVERFGSAEQVGFFRRGGREGRYSCLRVPYSTVSGAS
ncbi:MAG: hypothetical protein AAF555_02605 [Verrucomicrobiota bacterium]